MPGARLLGHVDVVSSFPEEPIGRTPVLTTKPVIIRGIERLGAMHRWTPELISERLGDREVTVSIADEDGAFRYDPTARQGLRFDKMPGSKLVAELRNVASGRRMSMQQMSITGELPELRDDLVIPPYVPEAVINEINLWMASAASRTPLHYDHMNNLFAQLDGKKRFKLFAPDQADKLYPGALDIHTRHLSRVDVNDPDLEQFPNYREAEYWEAEVVPGDLLLIPAFWWHQVSAPEVSVSVNYWWRADVRDCACPAFFRQLYMDLVVDQVRGLFLTHDLRPLGNGSDAVLALAEWVNEQGEAGAAERLCGGVIVAAARAAAQESGIENRSELGDLLAQLETRSVWSGQEIDLARRGMTQAAAAQLGVPRAVGQARELIEALRGSKLSWQHPASAVAGG